MPAVCEIAEVNRPNAMKSVVIVAVRKSVAKIDSGGMPPNRLQMNRNGTSESTSSIGSAAAPRNFPSVSAGARMAARRNRSIIPRRRS
jgi:hypothetical protein